MLNNIKKVIIIWCNIFRKKRISSSILRDDNFPVRSGKWFIGSEFSRHIAIKKLPPPLDTVKQWGGWRTGRVLKFFVNISEISIFPWFVNVSSDKSYEFFADVILVNRLHEPVGFDLKEKKVIRIMSVDEAHKHTESVSHLSKFYNCAAYHIDQSSGFVIEEMVDGISFSRSSIKNRTESVSKLFIGLDKADNTTLSDGSMHHWSEKCQQLISRLNSYGIDVKKVAFKLDDIFIQAKISWTHGDLFGENIIINNERGPILIDYDKYGVAPSFTEMMTLFVFEARTQQKDLINSFFKGHYDKEFLNLGISFSHHDVLENKIALFISWLGWKLTTEEFSEINLERFFDVISPYINEKLLRIVDE